jgi:hypothetical protein
MGDVEVTRIISIAAIFCLILFNYNLPIIVFAFYFPFLYN